MSNRNFHLLTSIFCCCLFCFGPQAWATQEHYSGESSGTSIQGTTFLVKDGKIGHPLWDDIQQTLSVKNMILFEMDEDDPGIVPVSGVYQVDLSIEVWYAGQVNNPNPSATLTKSLSFDYDINSENPSEFRDIYPLTNVYQMRITVNAVLLPSGITGPPPSLRVYGELIVDRIYNFNCNQTVSINTPPNTGVAQDYLVEWTPIATADEYDLEWTFYDALSVVGSDIQSGGGEPDDDYDWLFKQNATRITTDQNQYKINLIYPAGYLFFRLRAVHYTATGGREYSQWSSLLPGDDQLITNFPHKIEVLWHDPNYNWQSQIIYAEEGKNVPSVNYFDGSLRQRQAVTLSNTDNTTIIQQSIYDHQGRPAVNVLPAPSNVPHIAYNPSFVLSATGNYTKDNFDLGDCSESPDPMSTLTGASRYYSSSNPKAGIGFNKYIPDAEQYPFTVTEYTPDQSGRIKAQGGVGPTHKLGGGHDTKYYYGKPAQEELDRLFGNEVGYASHYLKNAVVDPNGQVSVSYIDAHGRTIATALAGDVPQNVSQVSDPGAQFRGNTKQDRELTIDLLNNIRSTYEISSSYTLLVTTAGVEHAFTYNLDADFYQPSCVDPSICYDCIYDLSISISDNCNSEIYSVILPNYTIGTPLSFDLLCNVPPQGIAQTFPLNNLEIGEYKITKKLSINQEALSYYANHFISQANCIPDIGDLVTQMTNEVDLSGCEISCETCLTELGDEAAFVAQIRDAILAADGGVFTAADELAVKEQFAQMVLACNGPLCAK